MSGSAGSYENTHLNIPFNLIDRDTRGWLSELSPERIPVDRKAELGAAAFAQAHNEFTSLQLQRNSRHTSKPYPTSRIHDRYHSMLTGASRRGSIKDPDLIVHFIDKRFNVSPAEQNDRNDIIYQEFGPTHDTSDVLEILPIMDASAEAAGENEYFLPDEQGKIGPAYQPGHTNWAVHPQYGAIDPFAVSTMKVQFKDRKAFKKYEKAVRDLGVRRITAGTMDDQATTNVNDLYFQHVDPELYENPFIFTALGDPSPPYPRPHHWHALEYVENQLDKVAARKLVKIRKDQQTRDKRRGFDALLPPEETKKRKSENPKTEKPQKRRKVFN